jgi:hypothetical protein
MRTRRHAGEIVATPDVEVMKLRAGTSWATVSDNVKHLVEMWEAEGAFAGSRLATRKDAIRCAVGLALRAAGRNPRSSTRA